MEQKIDRITYSSLDDEVKYMKELGYTIKQISGTGDNYYVWVLFEKDTNIKTDTTI